MGYNYVNCTLYRNLGYKDLPEVTVMPTFFLAADDCWMTATRNAQGQQVADPTKFPDGFQAVAAYIHSLGMKSGL